jgi:hypothetical protein
MANAARLQLPPALSRALAVNDGQVQVLDEPGLRGDGLDALVHDAVFGDDRARAARAGGSGRPPSRWASRPPRSTICTSRAGAGDTPVNFTVPAINLRMMAYDSARAVFRAAQRLDAGALIFEIARSRSATPTSARPVHRRGA